MRFFSSPRTLAYPGGNSTLGGGRKQRIRRVQAPERTPIAGAFGDRARANVNLVAFFRFVVT